MNETLSPHLDGDPRPRYSRGNPRPRWFDGNPARLFLQIVLASLREIVEMREHESKATRTPDRGRRESHPYIPHLHDAQTQERIPEGGGSCTGLSLGEETLGRSRKLQTMMKLTWTERGYLALWYVALCGIILLLAMAL